MFYNTNLGCSNTFFYIFPLALAIVGASIKVLELLTNSTHLRDKLAKNTQYFRSQMTAAGFDITKGTYPIISIMLYEEKLAQEFIKKITKKRIYVIRFFFPVAPKGRARI